MKPEVFFIGGIKIQKIDKNRYYVITFDKNPGSRTGYFSKKSLMRYLETKGVTVDFSK